MIYVVLLVTSIGCYFIGVLVGRLSVKQSIKPCADADDIQHVSYTPEQMGYEK